MLDNVANIAKGLCTHSMNPPNVTVAGSGHLLVNWADSFEGCDSKNIESARVETNRMISFVNFDDKKANVSADPCKKTMVRVELKYFNKHQNSITSVWSQIFSYNAHSPLLPHALKIFYSGLLHEQVANKVFIRSNGKLSIPDIY